MLTLDEELIFGFLIKFSAGIKHYPFVEFMADVGRASPGMGNERFLKAIHGLQEKGLVKRTTILKNIGAGKQPLAGIELGDPRDIVTKRLASP